MRFVVYAFAIVGGFALIGCNQGKEVNLPTDNQPSTNKLGHLRLHFAGFAKSKSGATWMAWPDAVNQALAGLSGIEEVEMEMGRDEFIVAYDSGKVSKSDILAACEKSGFPATVVQYVQAGDSNDDRTSSSEFTPPPFYVEALATAESENKPLVLDFMADWCAPCKRLANETFVDKKVAALLEQCVLLKIDTDEHPELAKHFNVASLPDIRFLSPDGMEIKSIAGFQSVDSFAMELTTLLNSSDNNRSNE